MGKKPPANALEPKVSGGQAAIYNSELDLCDLRKRSNIEAARGLCGFLSQFTRGGRAGSQRSFDQLPKEQAQKRPGRHPGGTQRHLLIAASFRT